MVLAAALAAARKPAITSGRMRPDQPHVVAEDLVVPPLLERLLDAEREAEVDRAREVLLGAVEAMDRQQLLGPQHAERLEELRADLVLPAVAARRGDERRAMPCPRFSIASSPLFSSSGCAVGLHEDAGCCRDAQREAERDVPGSSSTARPASARERDVQSPTSSQDDR